MIQGYKYEIKVNNKQRSALQVCAEINDTVYNMTIRAIYDRFDANTENRFWKLNELQGEWRKTRDANPRLKSMCEGVPSMVANFACLRADQAYKRWWKKKAKKPREKKRRGSKFTIYRPDYGKNWIKIPKVGIVKAKEKIRFEGEVGSVAFSKRAGRWWASFSVDTEKDIKESNGGVVGIDWGLNAFVTLSTGEKVEAPKPYAKELKRLKRLQRQYSRKQKGSKNQKKLNAVIAKTHFKVAEIRKDFINKLSKRLTKEYGAIGIENLNMAGMIKNRHLSKAIQDAGAGEFFRQLKYKAEWYGCEIVEADRWYPSSQTCSDCGLILSGDQKLQLNQRTFLCPGCGFECDRDVNAAKNLENLIVDRERFSRIDAPEESPSRATSEDCDVVERPRGTGKQVALFSA